MKSPETPQKQGPKYLRPHLTMPDPDLAEKYPITHDDVEWMGQLISSTGNKYFTIRYFGDLVEEHTILRTEEEGLPQKVVAVDAESGEEILLFDKAIHGWEGFAGGHFAKAEKMERPANQPYRSQYGTDTFRLLFYAFYNAGMTEELKLAVEEDGLVRLGAIDGLPLQDAFDDAFDWVVIYAIDKAGNQQVLIDEELR